MLLGYNTNGLQSHRLEDALELLADRGYQAVALTLDVQHLDPFRCTAADVAAVAQRLERLGLTPIVETGARFLLDPRHKHEPTLMTRDRAARQRRLDFYGRCAAVGRDLGARTLSFWSGIDRVRDADSESWLDEGVRAACAVVRDRGLQPALEPEPGMAVGSMADWDRLVGSLGGDAPALTLDVGHLYVTEDEPALDLIRRYAGSLAQVHLEDMRRGVHEHLMPGEGEVDFGGVYAALEESSFRQAVCFELSRDSHRAVEAVDRCASLWRGLGRSR